MEEFNKIQLDEINMLQEKLEKARQDQSDIYQIARLLQILKLKGVVVNVTEQESVQILENLEKARKGETKRPFSNGYEIARWLMIQKALNIKVVEIREDDKIAIIEAVEKYKDEENFRQLASLIKTAEFIGTPISFENFTEKEKKAITEELKLID